MQPLVLEYVFEGHQRGYNFTSPTRGYNDALLKTIWRSAMPRGQGWNGYIGARSLKSFPLDDGRVALSEVTVTDLRDESGRSGIRRAVIQVMYPGAFTEYLKDRLRRYPADVQAQLERWPSFGQRQRLLGRGVRGAAQTVCVYPYTTPDAWQFAEATTLKLATSPGLLLRAEPMAFTTLALDYRDESPLVVLPTARAERLNGVATLPL